MSIHIIVGPQVLKSEAAEQVETARQLHSTGLGAGRPTAPSTPH